MSRALRLSLVYIEGLLPLLLLFLSSQKVLAYSLVPRFALETPHSPPMLSLATESRSTSRIPSLAPTWRVSLRIAIGYWIPYSGHRGNGSTSTTHFTMETSTLHLSQDRKHIPAAVTNGRQTQGVLRQVHPSNPQVVFHFEVLSISNFIQPSFFLVFHIFPSRIFHSQSAPRYFSLPASLCFTLSFVRLNSSPPFPPCTSILLKTHVVGWHRYIFLSASIANHTH